MIISILTERHCEQRIIVTSDNIQRLLWQHKLNKNIFTKINSVVVYIQYDKLSQHTQSLMKMFGKRLATKRCTKARLYSADVVELQQQQGAIVRDLRAHRSSTSLHVFVCCFCNWENIKYCVAYGIEQDFVVLTLNDDRMCLLIEFDDCIRVVVVWNVNNLLRHVN